MSQEQTAIKAANAVVEACYWQSLRKRSDLPTP